MMLIAPAPDTLDAYLDNAVAWAQVLNGPGFPVDEAKVRAQAAVSFERSYYPQGTGRQLAAVLASGSRREALKAVHVPTLVIHGKADPLVPVEGGMDTAVSIPNAKLLLIDGLGHALPPATWPEMVAAIADHAT
jgi:pimeloyl-ACP methyl ester carboxylesterase